MFILASSVHVKALAGTFLNIVYIKVTSMSKLDNSTLLVLVAPNIKVHGWFMYSAAAILVIQWKVSERLK